MGQYQSKRRSLSQHYNHGVNYSFHFRSKKSFDRISKQILNKKKERNCIGKFDSKIVISYKWILVIILVVSTIKGI